MAKREWSEIKSCTAPRCQHQFVEGEERHFVKMLCIIRLPGGPKLAFWGGVLCEDCLGRVKKLVSGCRHDFGAGEQIGQLFIDELDIKKEPFVNFCGSCFSKILPELGKFLLPWKDFMTMLRFFSQS